MFFYFLFFSLNFFSLFSTDLIFTLVRPFDRTEQNGKRDTLQKDVSQYVYILEVFVPGGWGGHLGIFWLGMCRPGLQIGTPCIHTYIHNLY